MKNENKSNSNQRPKIHINDDKGLAPVTSGTPMPKVKPPATTPTPTQKSSE
jgi:hypothetical protein